MDSREAHLPETTRHISIHRAGCIDLTRIYQVGGVDDGQRLVQLSSNDPSRRPWARNRSAIPALFLTPVYLASNLCICGSLYGC